MIHKEKHAGDVNKIKFCGRSVFMTASSNGSVSLHHIADSRESSASSNDAAAVRTQKTWDNIHSGRSDYMNFQNVQNKVNDSDFSNMFNFKNQFISVCVSKTTQLSSLTLVLSDQFPSIV